MRRIPDFSRTAFVPRSLPLPKGETWRTSEGIEVRPTYTRDDVAGIDPAGAWPGIPPYLRGPYPTMYVAQPWTIRQYAGFSTAEESNAFYRRNLAQGQMGLSIAFDLPTHRGYDSDHPRVAGDVGMAGVAIDSIIDMRTLFEGIPLDRMSVSMTMNGACCRSWRSISSPARSRACRRINSRVPSRTTSSGIHGAEHLHLSAAPIDADRLRHLCLHLGAHPKFNSISISGYHMQGGGATADLELGYTLADGVEYVRAGIAAGLDVDRFAPRLSFFFATGMNFFMEVAKLRAARHLLGETHERFRAQGRALARSAHPLPDLGLEPCGTGSLQQHRAHRDRGDGRRRRAARSRSTPTRWMKHWRSLPIFPRASHATPSSSSPTRREPAGHRSLGRQLFHRGLTADLAARAMEHIEEVEKLGGMAKAIEQGLPSSGSREAATRTQARIDSAEQIVVGVNAYSPAEATVIEIRKVDNTAVRLRQIEKLDRLRAERDPARCQAALDRLSATARTHEGNLLATAVEAARARATVGELSLALEKVWNRHVAEVRTVAGIYAEASPKGADKIDAARQAVCGIQRGRRKNRPRLLVAKIGQDGMTAARR